MAQWQVRLSTVKGGKMNDKHTILDRESAKTSLRKCQKRIWISVDRLQGKKKSKRKGPDTGMC